MEKREPPKADLVMLEYIIWYGRNKRGKTEDVARYLWEECPYVRLSEPGAMHPDNWCPPEAFSLPSKKVD